MLIKVDLSALRHGHIYEYILRFVLGGTVTALTGLLSEHWGPVVGGLFLAFPAIFPASATLVEKHEREKKKRAGIAQTVRGRLAAALDARGATMGVMGATLFAWIAWKCLAHGYLSLGLFSALLGWLMLSALLWYVRKHHPWKRPKT